MMPYPDLSMSGSPRFAAVAGSPRFAAVAGVNAYSHGGHGPLRQGGIGAYQFGGGGPLRQGAFPVVGPDVNAYADGGHGPLTKGGLSGLGALHLNASAAASFNGRKAGEYGWGVKPGGPYASTSAANLVQDTWKHQHHYEGYAAGGSPIGGGNPCPSKFGHPCGNRDGMIGLRTLQTIWNDAADPSVTGERKAIALKLKSGLRFPSGMRSTVPPPPSDVIGTGGGSGGGGGGQGFTPPAGDNKMVKVALLGAVALGAAFMLAKGSKKKGKAPIRKGRVKKGRRAYA